MQAIDDRLVAIGDALEHGVRDAVIDRHTHRRRSRLLVIAAVAIVATAGSAVAASTLLGGPAAGPVQSAIDAFYPSNDDALAPAPNGGAVAVATSRDDVLYRVPARDGASTCLVVVLADPGRARSIPGEGCFASGTGDGFFEIGIASESTGDGRRVVYGQVHAPSGGSLWFEPVDETPVQVPTGVDGFFLLERQAQDRGSDPDPHLVPLGRLVVRNASGAEVAARPLSYLSTVATTP
jgi:hypothetical protein